MTVIFCSLLSTDKLGASLVTLQSVCCLALDVLDRYRGSLRQLLHEDKGITLIALFGLPGNNFYDDAVRAVRCALRLQRELRRMGIKVSMGICTGRIFCGTVGSKYASAFR